MIPFNKPYLTGYETKYIEQAVALGKLSGNGFFTKKCQQFFEENYGFKKALLTSSCTDALEMCALLLNIQDGDEVIMPSYTFVSTANAFVLRGATIRFADSETDTPNIDASKLESLINKNTKAIVVVHYAGMACDMDAIMHLATKHGLYVVEDAAQAIDSYYNGKRLGSIGHLAAFSFHETKNIISGEGGLLAVNDIQFCERAEILWEKGTNRSAFFRGEIDKYGWIDIGSSFLPSEVTAAFLWAQLENIEKIQNKRKEIWHFYNDALQELSHKKCVLLPKVPDYATSNGHLFYILCRSQTERARLIQFLKEHNILSVFHYISLHTSPYYKDKYTGGVLENADRYSETLVRLPLYYELEIKEQQHIAASIKKFFST
ncbi:dTDP-4-amino-4,6-dideoxygalactose transaminase [Marixanthomonas sp. SCSIO 43207]|uniref:dTDP-4-amino-4,6-dideoxygalactose transaminase n=1 Tax=Marixanthomonas sp. SCSIO 43207 TaxID=2779360 RepID=UPI001CA822E2|nr:dTDP-4-amino-4,6-dideoxygalactose transaminase [Marixanthomonas sp. SCSIO 43207]UAB81235.1 dTDP-4-amino-4,6-dideoxygalactose transaminase [Marixanthomonas sp. SCSIO 43207]